MYKNLPAIKETGGYKVIISKVNRTDIRVDLWAPAPEYGRRATVHLVDSKRLNEISVEIILSTRADDGLSCHGSGSMFSDVIGHPIELNVNTLKERFDEFDIQFRVGVLTTRKEK